MARNISRPAPTWCFAGDLSVWLVEPVQNLFRLDEKHFVITYGPGKPLQPARGVSASKEDVHNAIRNIDKGIFPEHSAR